MGPGAPNSKRSSNHDAVDISSRQMQTSNETLNMFLGGRRPSWLTSEGAQAALQHTRERSKSTAQQGLEQSQSTAIHANDAQRRHDSSTSSSPRPANIAMAPPLQTIPLSALSPPQTPVLPSPSPSDDSVLDSAFAAAIARPAETGYQTNSELLTQAQMDALVAATGRKRAAEHNAFTLSKRIRVDGMNGQAQAWVEPIQRPVYSPSLPTASSPTNHAGIYGGQPPRNNSMLLPSQIQMQPGPVDRTVSPAQMQKVPEPLPARITTTMGDIRNRFATQQMGDPAWMPQDTQRRLYSNGALVASSPADSPLLDQAIFTSVGQHGLVRSTSRPRQPQPGSPSSSLNVNIVRQSTHAQTVAGSAPQNLGSSPPSEIQQQLAQQEWQQQFNQQQLTQIQLQEQQHLQELHRQQQPQHQEIHRQQQMPKRIQVRMAPPSNMPYHNSICWPKINKFIQEDSRNPYPPIAKGRMDAVLSAISQDDAAFLFMHQVLCLHSLYPDSVPQQLTTLGTFDTAIYALNTILKPTPHLHRRLLMFFSTFPIGLGEVAMHWTQTYHTGVEHTKQLLTRFGPSWPGYYQACRARGYPPIASELFHCLGVLSPVLMEHIFAVLLQIAWAPNMEPGPLHFEAMNLFRANRDWFLGRLHGPGGIREDERLAVENCYLKALVGLRQRLDASRQPFLSAHSTRQTPVVGPGGPVQRHDSLPGPQRSPNAIDGIVPPVQRNDLGSRYPPFPPSTQLPPSPQQGQFNVTTQSNGPPRQFQAHRDSLLFPIQGAGVPAMPANPTWQLSALHQAHLRSPELNPQDDLSNWGSKASMYQYVMGFALEPKRLTLGSLVHERTFVVSPEVKALVPPTIPSSSGGRSMRNVTEKSIQYRLRCSRGSRSEKVIEEQGWVISDTSFPTYAYLRLNDTILEIRRKLHNCKDLSIDVTHLVVAGKNTLEISLNSTMDKPDYDLYAFAVEMIAIKKDDTILQECQTRMQPAHEVLASIKASLTEAPANDDDLAIISENFQIDIFDPISLAQKITTPVRSTHCTHRSCYDLGTFLETRARTKPNYPSQVDVWRCPICRGDARPQTLFLDGFILEVQKKLEADNDTETRTIIVLQDGSWKPKKEKIGNNSNKRHSMNPPSRAASISRPPGKSATTSPAQTPIGTPTMLAPSTFVVPSSLHSVVPQPIQAPTLPNQLQGQTRRPPVIIDLGSDSG